MKLGPFAALDGDVFGSSADAFFTGVLSDLSRRLGTAGSESPVTRLSGVGNLSTDESVSPSTCIALDVDDFLLDTLFCCCDDDALLVVVVV